MRTLSVCLALSIGVFPLRVAAQPKLQKDETVVLKLPMSVLKMGKHRSGWSWGPLAHLEATVEAGPNGLTINGDPNWQVGGFPSLLELKVKKIKFAKNDESNAEIELQKGSRPYGPEIRLLFKTDVKSAFPKVVATPAEVDAYREEAYGALAAKFFTGPLAQLTAEEKRTLVSFAHVTAKGTTMGSVTYKDKLYLVVDVGEDENVYNELRMNQAQRAARVLNDRLLATLKAFAKVVENEKVVQGLKLELDIPHRSFADAAALPVNDKLQLYAPAEEIKKFADADITSQQFIDGCVVIVNDNRVSVPLSN